MKNSYTALTYQLTYREWKTYLYSLFFIMGNILLPQLCHLLPQGGLILLPIYFFTLVGAYRYGSILGLLTAVCSAVVNNLLFGMPPSPMLLPIMIKGAALALAASWVAMNSRKPIMLNMVIIVLAYQIVGTLAEWAISDNLHAALQDFIIGWPGMLLQVFGGYAIIKMLARK